MNKTLLAASAAVFALLDCGPALAQAVDYGALEEVFGEPVTTSATGKPQKISDVPMDMEILTQDDIRRSGADNIPDVLQFVTGVNFRRSSFNDGEVGIGGYDQPWNPRLLVLVNDRPVYEDFYGDVVWSAFPVQLDEIRQIEIVKGPNSALFGFNAASGVINIVTFDPLSDKTNVVTGRTGTQSLKEGSAVATVQDPGKYGIRLSTGGMTAREFSTDKLPAGNANGIVGPRNETVNVDSRFQVAPGVQLSLEANAGGMRRNFPADATPEDDDTNTIRGRLKASTAVGLVDFDLYRTVWNIDYEGSQAQKAHNVATDARLSDLFMVGTDHTFRINGEYKNNSATGQFFNDSTIGYNVYSLGAMWNWQLTPKLSLTNAVRNDYLALYENGQILPATGLTSSNYNRSIDATSFNSGLVYNATDIDTLRFMVSRGYQLPSLDDLGQQIVEPGSPPTVLAGSPSLTPTAVLNVEAGYDHTVKSLDTVFRTGVFDQRNTHLFGYDVTAVTASLYQSQNIGNSNEVGWEIGARSAPHTPLRWNLSYFLSTIHDDISPNIAAGAYSAFQSSTPVHTVYSGLGYTFGKWELDTQARWQSQYVDYQYNTVSGAYQPDTIHNYVTVNARAGYNVTDNVTLATTVEQLNQAQIQERDSVPVERRVIFSASVHF